MLIVTAKLTKADQYQIGIPKGQTASDLLPDEITYRKYIV